MDFVRRKRPMGSATRHQAGIFHSEISRSSRRAVHLYRQKPVHVEARLHRVPRLRSLPTLWQTLPIATPGDDYGPIRTVSVPPASRHQAARELPTPGVTLIRHVVFVRATTVL